MSIRTMRTLSQQSQRRIESLLGRVINPLKITSILCNKTEVNKGFDPFTISWSDEGKALQEFCLFVKKELYPVLGPLFKIGAHAAYRKEAILDVLMYMAVNAIILAAVSNIVTKTSIAVLFGSAEFKKCILAASAAVMVVGLLTILV